MEPFHAPPWERGRPGRKTRTWERARLARQCVVCFLICTGALLAVSWTSDLRMWAAASTPQGVRSATAVEAQTVAYPSGPATIDAYLARPSAPGRSARLPAVLVIHDELGLNDAVRETARLFATEGFMALAPDLVSRLSGRSPAAPSEADRRRSPVAALPPAQTVQDVGAAFAFLQGDAGVDAGSIAIVGIGWGGWRAFKLAEQAPTLYRAVVFYGTTSDDSQLHRIRTPILGHYAEYDFETTAQVLATKRRLGGRFTYFIYPDMDRGFLGGGGGAIDYVALIRGRAPEDAGAARADQRGDARLAAAVKLAWERTLAFFRAQLG